MSHEKIEIEFAHGVLVQLAELHQKRTYEGLLEGLPTKEMNSQQIQALRNEHRSLHLIQPTERPIEWEGPTPYPFGTPSSLPPIQCVARLQAREDPVSIREGIFAWFQGTWAPPIEEATLGEFGRLDWVKHSQRQEL